MKIYRFSIGKEKEDGDNWKSEDLTFSPLHEVEISDEVAKSIFQNHPIARLDIIQGETCAIVAKNLNDLKCVSSGMSILLDLQKNWDKQFSESEKERMTNMLDKEVQQKC
uniref:Uncharacterized protein n=1 Tax=viral metagenome TaxID=1070528 RepID=A0A6M3IK05_9ZZZZ